MNDDVGRGLFGGAGQRLHVLEHGDRVAIAIRALQNGAARLLEMRIVIGRHAVEAVDKMPDVEQTLRQMKADEAGRAGHEDAHEPAIFPRDESFALMGEGGQPVNVAARPWVFSPARHMLARKEEKPPWLMRPAQRRRA